MNSSSMVKSKVFAAIALGLLLYGFVVPSVVFKGTVERAHMGSEEKIPQITYKLCNYYTKSRYYSSQAPKDARGDLKKMIQNDAEIGVASTPIWYVALEAPNYPKEAFPEGIPVYYHFDGFSGDVHEMNTINHFIGMDPMERGAPYLRAYSPYILVFVAFLMFLYILYDKKALNWIMLLPVSLPVFFLSFYAYWLYWFGHNMHEYGAFKIKPFMPTVFGDGKVAQFTTHSYPTTGFWMLLAISIFSILAILSRSKAYRTQE